LKFSLLVATLNRSCEIKELLSSLLESNESRFEVIIVDQSDNDLTKNVIEEFKQLDVKYVKSLKKGLSFNRNIALEMAIGDYYCFPDDDCKFYPDTLSEVLSQFEHCNVDVILGRIYDRNRQKNVLKAWPVGKKKVTKLNVYFLSSSITMFYSKKCKNIKFDEIMGVGARYGACEDPDYLYRTISLGYTGVYNSKVELWHPEQIQKVLPLDRVKSYASGFGFFINKNKSLFHYILLSVYLLSKLIKLLSGKVSLKQFQSTISGILNGYFRK